MLKLEVQKAKKLPFWWYWKDDTTQKIAICLYKLGYTPNESTWPEDEETLIYGYGKLGCGRLGLFRFNLPFDYPVEYYKTKIK
jgi:hypothetical protein